MAADNNRILSIDAFRGFTIALMILVNNPGSPEFELPQLRHAAWHGWTLSDLVFPFFIFIMGAASAFSLGESHERKRSRLYIKILRRSLLLFGLGLLANFSPNAGLSTLRIFGVLQRLGVCYFFSSMAVISFGQRGRVIFTAVLLIAYWLIMALIPFPGMGFDPWAKGSNLAQYLDSLLLGGHTWVPGLEPEGIISTVPAIATAMIGFFAGRWMGLPADPRGKNLLLFIWANGLILVSLIIEPFMPVNKQLWTVTYALFTAGMALNFLGVFYWLADVKGEKKFFQWLIIFGSNSLSIFYLSIIIAKAVRFTAVGTADGVNVPLKKYIFENFMRDYFGSTAGALIYPLILILVLFLFAWFMHAKKIFLRL